MKLDSRLSDVLHVLLHLADQRAPLTSTSLASMLRTNPVVVRRTLSGLREQGLVTAAKGRAGGWTLSCDLTQVTLLDVYQAVGAPRVFAMGSRDSASRCLVEHAVNDALAGAMREAEALLIERFRSITLASLHDTFNSELAALLGSPTTNSDQRAGGAVHHE